MRCRVETAASLGQDNERTQLEDRGLAAFQRGGTPAYAQVRLDVIRTHKASAMMRKTSLHHSRTLAMAILMLR